MSFLSNLASNIPGYGRPAKRQKTDSPTSPAQNGSATPKSRSSKKAIGSGGKSVLVYGSAKGKKPSQKNALESAENHGDGRDGPELESSFTDSAYYSMTTAQEETSEKDAMALDDTPSRKAKGRPRKLQAPDTPSKKRSRGEEDVSGSEDELATPIARTSKDATPAKGSRKSSRTEREDSGKAHGESDEVADTIEGSRAGDMDREGSAPRSSGRARKKSQKKIEAEQADTIVVASSRKKSRSASERGTPAATKAAVTPRSRATKQKVKTASATRKPAGPGATPSTGKRRGRPPKAKHIEVEIQREPGEVFFEDISSKKPTAKPSVEHQADAAELETIITEALEAAEPVVEEEVAVNLTTPSKIRGKAVDFALDLPQATEEDAGTVTLDSSDTDCSTKLQALTDALVDPECAIAYATLRENILKGLTGKARLPLVGLGPEYSKVYQLVEQTIVAGEGNSMLIIGSRGTAKTTMVETVIDKLKPLHGDDFHVVRLNGFIHTDDKIALKEIWRQLGREMQVEDEDLATRSNYADTLASLLALLSHPTEFSEDAADKTSKSVIFIIDEFEQFASHPRQTLLYNLFDISQSRKAPIAVLGLTTRIDVTQSLEKRVKSRFSHRYVHLSLAKTYSAFLSIAKTALHASDPTDTPNPSAHPTLHPLWSAYITSLLATSPINFLLQQLFYTTKSTPQLLSSLLPAFLLSPPSTPPPLSSFTTSLASLHPPDSKLPLLHGLSSLSLALLISAARLDILLSTDAVTFAMAYEEYAALTNRTRVVAGASGAGALSGMGAGRVWEREVALGAWEDLCDGGLLVPVTGEGGKGGEGRLWRCDVTLEEVGVECTREELGVMGKWCREMAL